MSHGNARTTVHGRLLIVQRHQAGWPQAHIAAAMGVSRKCVKTWIDRYAAEGEAGSGRPVLAPAHDARPGPAPRSSRGRGCRAEQRAGRTGSAPKLGVPARTVSRILRRHQVPVLRQCDPITGEVIRASKHTAVRYERDRPGELVHMDVKKLGRIPDGGGWRAHGRERRQAAKQQAATIGYDYVHSVVDDHSRLAYSEVLPDEKGTTCAGFLARAAAYFAAHGITRIERSMTDNALAYQRSRLKRVVRRAGRQADVHPSPTAPGRTARSNASTAPWPSSGPTARSSPATTTAPPPLRPGSSTTTLNAATAHSEDDHPSADCYQPDGRVHLARRLATGATTRARVVRLAAPGARTDVWPSDTAEASAPTMGTGASSYDGVRSDVVVQG